MNVTHFGSENTNFDKIVSDIARLQTSLESCSKIPSINPVHNVGAGALEGNKSPSPESRSLDLKSISKSSQSSREARVAADTLGLKNMALSDVSNKLNVVIKDLETCTLNDIQKDHCRTLINNISEQLETLHSNIIALHSPLKDKIVREITILHELTNKVLSSTTKVFPDSPPPSTQELFDIVKNGSSQELIAAIAKGADLSCKNEAGETLLYSAAQLGHLDLCLLLTQHPEAKKARLLEISDEDGMTPLGVAVLNGHFRICKYLLSVGANKNATDLHGYRLIDFAAYAGSREIFEMIMNKGVDVKLTNAMGQTPLFQAIRGGNIEICQLLIDAGVDITKADSEGVQAIHQAVLEGSKESCKLLLKHGANIDAIDNDGYTPLMYSFLDKNFKLSKFLVEAGANVNLVDIEGDTPINVATRTGSFGIVKLLLEHGADPNIRSESGYSPRGYALISHSIKKVKACFQNYVSEQIQQYDKELLYRKLLSHIFEFEGTTPFTLAVTDELSHEVELAGGYPEYFWQKMANSLALFSEIYSNSVDTDTMKFIVSGCQTATDSRHMSANVKLAIWKNHQPLLLNSGSADHHISFLLWDDIIIQCDRSEIVSSETDSDTEDETTTFEMCKFQGELTEDIISKIESQYTLSLEEFYKFTYSELPQLLNLAPDDKFSVPGMTLSEQRANTCAWSNSEGNIFSAMVLAECRKNNIDISIATEDVLQPIIDQQRNIFESWRSFQKLIMAEKYMNLCERPSRIFVPDWLLLGKSIAEGYIESKSIDNTDIADKWEKALQRFNTMAPGGIKQMVAVAAVGEIAIERTLRPKQDPEERGRGQGSGSGLTF